jgi:hypothetical protein
MRLPSLKLLAVTVLAVGLVGVVTDQVLASTPTIKGKGKVFQFVNFTAELSNFNANIAVVPEKQNLVITDIMVTNLSAVTGTFGVRCLDGDENPLILAPVFVGIDSTFVHSFSTGIQCPELTTAQVTIASDQQPTNGNWKVTVSGYFRKGAP